MHDEIEITVRFCETDAAGHVNNTSYFIYLEEARGNFLAEMRTDFHSRDILDGFILASTTCDYLDQAYFNQRLTISTSVSNIGTKSFTFNHTIRATATGEHIAEAKATLVCFNYKEQRTEAITPALRSLLEGYLVTV